MDYRDDQGLIPFCWTKPNDLGTDVKCCSWIITDETRLHSSGIFSEEAVRYLVNNQVEKFGITGSLPAELSIGSVVVYYYKGSFGNTSWWGYMITNPDQFERWCKSQALSQDMIKILVACQNTWIAETSTLYGDDNIRDVFPPAFVSALESVRYKQLRSDSLEEARTYIAVNETWFTSVIDSSPIRIQTIAQQFKHFRISENSRSEFSGGWGYYMRKIFLGNPVTRRIEVLTRNKDISGGQK